MEIDWPRSRWGRTFVIAWMLFILFAIVVLVGGILIGVLGNVGLFKLGIILGGGGWFIFVCWVLAGIVGD